jgi:hypothetical protein
MVVRRPTRLSSIADPQGAGADVARAGGAYRQPGARASPGARPDLGSPA